MSTSLCANCSSQLDSNSTYCSNCGHQVGAQVVDLTKTTFDRLHEQNQFGKDVEIDYDDKKSYQKYQDPKNYAQPVNYLHTSNQLKRIVGTLKLEVHVVEEIAASPNLQREAFRLFILNLTIVALIQAVTIMLLPGQVEVISLPGTIADIILTTYGTGFLFIYSIPYLGKFIGYSKEDVDQAVVIRGLSYAYFANTIETIISFYTAVTQSLVLAFVWITTFLYFFLVFAFVIRRTMHKGYTTSSLTLIVAIIALSIYQRGVLELIDVIFDGSYIFLD